jgi:hypothetical protein
MDFSDADIKRVWVERNATEEWYKIFYTVQREVRDMYGYKHVQDERGVGYTNSSLLPQFLTTMAFEIENTDGEDKYQTKDGNIPMRWVEIRNRKLDLIFRAQDEMSNKDEEKLEDKVARVGQQMQDGGPFMVLKNDKGYSVNCECSSGSK